MLTALVLFVSVYLAVRALMAKLLQNLQDASTVWNFRSPPNAKDSSTSFTGQGQDQGSYRYGSKVHWQSSAYNVDKYGVESVYVPKIPFSKQMENFEVRAYFKEWMPMEPQRHADHLHRCSIESCYKCVPMSKGLADTGRASEELYLSYLQENTTSLHAYSQTNLDF